VPRADASARHKERGAAGEQQQAEEARLERVEAGAGGRAISRKGVEEQVRDDQEQEEIASDAIKAASSTGWNPSPARPSRASRQPGGGLAPRREANALAHLALAPPSTYQDKPDPKGTAPADRRNTLEVVGRRRRAGGPFERPGLPGVVAGQHARAGAAQPLKKKIKNESVITNAPTVEILLNAAQPGRSGR